ncbi:MAG: hypothetical protein U0514_02430 [Candidatus Andersenbacteria bacterium]
MARYVAGLIIAAATSAVALAVVLLFLNPLTAGWLGLTILAASLYFLTVSLFTLLGFTARVWRSGREIIYAHLGTAFRQGLLLGVVVVGSLLLQAFRIFNIWSAVLFVVAVVLVELAFQSHANDVATRLHDAAAKPLDPRRAISDIKPKHIPVTDGTAVPQPWQHRFPEKSA